LLKLHGDYLDTQIRNTEQELDSFSPEIDVLLDRILDKHGLIICGWSSEWDNALRAAITRTPNRRYPMFWASRTAPSKLAADLIAHRNGRLVSITDADSFFNLLQQKIEIQTALQRPKASSESLKER